MSIVHIHTSTAEHVQGSLIQQVEVAKTSLASALDAVYYDDDATDVINTASIRIVELYNWDRFVKELYPANTDEHFKIDHDLQHRILYFVNTVDAVGKPPYTDKTFDAQIAGAKLVSDAVLVETFWSQKRCNVHLAKKFADFNTRFGRGDNGTVSAQVTQGCIVLLKPMGVVGAVPVAVNRVEEEPEKVGEASTVD
ncbi:hypothetical protein FA15DRAFT_704221 [Coprinopsis marcescibilis]|uniref:Uncharacterized protein n=1 Tax=Coprinopsis marcescibilis TaxID=230819 RepID=A0A5C3KW87_COPMA|nr:hypothetical protein FA15DRAFT_704221 [Coprinopsis marcescibilis]